MTFERIVTLTSLLISILAIIFSFLSTKIQLNYQLKRDSKNSRLAERDLCAEFLAYCKLVNSFGLSKEHLKKFTELYVKLHLVRNKELRSALLTCCDSMISQSENRFDDFYTCIKLFEKQFKDDLSI